MKHVKTVILLLVFFSSFVFSHGGGKNVKLHVNPKWKQCSIQLDSALNQSAWRQFTREAGLVSYFRPLTDAKPMGKGNYEFSLLQWQSKFDDTDDAWNHTFVHPDSTHWLKENDRLPFPGLTFRLGISEKMDLAAYWTSSPGANYGFFGAQVQYNIVQNWLNQWSASARLSFVSLYGPKDLDLSVYGLDVIASRDFTVYPKWLKVTPYVGLSSYMTDSHEKSSKLNLHDETAWGVQSMVGGVISISKARLAAEYNISNISTFSVKLGIVF